MSKQLARTVINGFNRQPAMLALAYADVLIDTIHQLSTANAKEENDSSSEARVNLLSAYGYETVSEEKPFAYANGIAFIPVHGLLINRFSGSWGWVTGYNFLREQMNAALADPDVNAIVYDCNSGGGMVAGCFELANEIFNSRSVKPSVAVVDAASYSACYAIASSCTKVIVTPSGGVGSVGVVAMHVDYSKMLQEAGVKVTFIYSGDHKIDGNPYQALPASVKADIQKSVNNTRQEFADLVSRNRGLDTKVVIDTEAACFTAAEGLNLGLVDAIATPIEAVRAFLNELSRSETQMETDPMSTSAANTGAEGTTEAQATQASTAAQVQVDAAAARQAERQRIAAITSHEAAADKLKLANHLALNTEMSVDDAVAVLSAAAPETVQKDTSAGQNAFEAAMNNSEHPNVGADASAANEGSTLSLAQQILKAQELATGVKH